MKLLVYAIPLLATTKNGVTATVKVSAQGTRAEGLERGLKCLLHLSSKIELPCVISTDISKLAIDTYRFGLGFANNLDVMMCLFPYHHHQDLAFGLLVQELVDPEIYQEATHLLDKASRETGRSKEDILVEASAFNNFPGRRDIDFVTAKHLPVVLDKLRHLLGEPAVGA